MFIFILFSQRIIFKKKAPVIQQRLFLLYILKNLKFGNSTSCGNFPHLAVRMTNNSSHFYFFLMVQTSELFLD
ncbi:MAG: hypothetical protein DCE86_04820 [Flavobacteriaceae bacterium]|nr:hypothetical protein ASG38_12595 [Flavobacterium sp. Leaf359]PZO33370.1 MAG: hypothetical protein DCE86_04820 [Flavobacteriaceae bacterium]